MYMSYIVTLIITIVLFAQGVSAMEQQKKLPSLAFVSDCLKKHYVINSHDFTPIYGGADMNARAYTVKTNNQSLYFVKIKQRSDSVWNITLVDLLHRSGMPCIVPVIKTNQGHVSLPIGDFYITVYPFMQGVNGFEKNLTDCQWIDLGKALKTLHNFKLPQSLIQNLPQENYSSTSRDYVRSFLGNIPESCAYNDEIAHNFLNFIQAHKATIERVVERADFLGNLIKTQDQKLVLCHGDIHAGNVLITEQGNIYIVDWDDLILAPKERDLMFIGGGVGNVWNNRHEELLFFQGYGDTKINYQILAYYRYERIVKDIVEYAEALLLKTGTNFDKDRHEMYGHFVAQFGPKGVVDCAFATDYSF